MHSQYSVSNNKIYIDIIHWCLVLYRVTYVGIQFDDFLEAVGEMSMTDTAVRLRAMFS